MAPSVRLSGISKQYGHFLANRNIDLSITGGSVHAIVGENGAGKSTLAKIIYGMEQPTSGSIAIDGVTVSFSSPAQAIRAGIGMVHQHFMLVPTLTVTENIVLGNEHCRLFSPLSLKEQTKIILHLAARHGLQLDPSARISDLSVGEAQRVEILKLLYRQASILILDEPTAVLSPPETGKLFSTLHSLRSEGKTIVLITHKLDEVLAVSDTVSVMRKGELAGTMPTKSVTREHLARMMVGRSVLMRIDNPAQQPGPPVLEIDHLGYISRNGGVKLKGLCLKVHEGEIYGIAGVEGNGQSELLSLLWGTWDRKSGTEGTITLCGQNLIGLSPSAVSALGVSMVPEDRLKHAVVPEYSVGENLLFGRHREKSFHRVAGFDRKALERFTGEMVEKYDIRCDLSSGPAIDSLSGGNQQKIVLAREISRPGIRLLVLAQPTRGVDIGAIEMIHVRIIEARKKGLAILLISSELEEIITLSTRIGCLFKGSIRHEFTADEVQKGRAGEFDFEQQIGLHIT